MLPCFHCKYSFVTSFPNSRNSAKTHRSWSPTILRKCYSVSSQAEIPEVLDFAHGLVGGNCHFVDCFVPQAWSPDFDLPVGQRHGVTAMPADISGFLAGPARPTGDLFGARHQDHFPAS